MTVSIEFLILCLLVCAFFCGWFAKIGYEQYKADQEREEQAKERRQAYEENSEYIKQINRNNLFVSWCEEAKGGAKK
jgi:cell division protein FtsB